DALPLALAVLEVTLVKTAVGERSDAAAVLLAVLELSLIPFADFAVVEPLQRARPLGQAVGTVASPGDRLAGAGIGVPHLAARLLIGDPVAVRLREYGRHGNQRRDDEGQTGRRCHGAYCAVMPPSITSSEPVTQADSSDARNSTPLAMSTAVPS